MAWWDARECAEDGCRVRVAALEVGGQHRKKKIRVIRVAGGGVHCRRHQHRHDFVWRAARPNAKLDRDRVGVLDVACRSQEPRRAQSHVVCDEAGAVPHVAAKRGGAEHRRRRQVGAAECRAAGAVRGGRCLGAPHAEHGEPVEAGRRHARHGAGVEARSWLWMLLFA